jgi:probable biosynthetic protein (TIGR04098 family)
MAGGVRKLPSLSREGLLALVQGENEDLGPDVLDLPLAECGIDSFGLISLRIGIEAATGQAMADADWQSLSTLGDLVGTDASVAAPQQAAVVPLAAASPQTPLANVAEDAGLTDAGPPVLALPGGERRRYRVNQPQMAMRGLGESWLMKEIGDIHWSTLTRDLKSSSSALSDSSGARLYATFTRVCWRASDPLVEFRESEPLVLESHLSRHGAAMFFSHLQGRGAVATLDVEVMSSFAKYGEAGVNSSLLKGQPVIPDDSAARVLDGLPAFASEYRSLRASDPGPSLFECDYELLPPHDINGVGLLYFAAYPMIMELCLMRHAGRAAVADWSLVERDICYFANAEPTEVLRFRLHHLEEVDGVLRYTASLARTSDGKMMALSRAAKRKVDLPPPGQPLEPRA